MKELSPEALTMLTKRVVWLSKEKDDTPLQELIDAGLVWDSFGYKGFCILTKAGMAYKELIQS